MRRKIVRWLSLAFVVCFFVAVFMVPNAAFSSQPIRLFIDGRDIYPEVPPIIANGRVMVPLRFVAEAMGAEVIWEEATRQVFVDSRKYIEWNNGFQKGYEQGLKEGAGQVGAQAGGGYEEAYNRGYQQGYADGEASVSNASNDNNYTGGWNDGYQAGYKDAQSQLVSNNDEWYKKGYREGYQQAIEGLPGMPGIYGDNETKWTLIEALKLLYNKAPTWYEFVTRWVKFIEIKPLDGKVGEVTTSIVGRGSASFNLIYIAPLGSAWTSSGVRDDIKLMFVASLLVHEATHVQDFQEGRLPKEINALSNEKAVLKQLGAPPNTIESITEEMLNHPWEKILQDLFS